MSGNCSWAGIYAQDFQDYIPGNHWQMEAGGTALRATAELDFLAGSNRQADNSDNTNAALFTDSSWSSLGAYTRSANIIAARPAG